jgi:hypothetical protein
VESRRKPIRVKVKIPIDTNILSELRKRHLANPLCSQIEANVFQPVPVSLKCIFPRAASQAALNMDSQTVCCAGRFVNSLAQGRVRMNRCFDLFVGCLERDSEAELSN